MGYLVGSYNSFVQGKRLQGIQKAIDGLGTLLHHLSTSLTLTCVMLHLFPRSRAITAGCVVPIMQHMFALLKYWNRTAFLVIELMLEVWFEWEVLTNLNAFNSSYGMAITRIGRSLAMSMLLAHWMYLSGSALNMVLGVLGWADDDEGELQSMLSASEILDKESGKILGIPQQLSIQAQRVHVEAMVEAQVEQPAAMADEAMVEAQVEQLRQVLNGDPALQL